MSSDRDESVFIRSLIRREKSSVTQPFEWHYNKISVPYRLSFSETALQYLFHFMLSSSRRTIRYLFLSYCSPQGGQYSHLVLSSSRKTIQYFFLSCCLLGEGQYSICSSRVVQLFGKGTAKTTSFQNKSNHLKMECKLKWWIP